MRHLTRAYIIIGALALLLLASCGKQQQAKGLVKDFVKENATEQIEISSFSRLDSTRVISDSLLQVLQEQAKGDPMFKTASLPMVGRKGQTLLYIRMRYMKDTLELSKTFYFNPDLDGIVAFK